MPAGPPEQLVLRDQRHDRHELAWATAGTLRVTIDRTLWALAGDRALWIPAGVRHDVAIEPGALALPVWFEQGPHGWARPTEIALSPDLRDRLYRYHQCHFSGVHPDDVDTATLLDLVERQAVAMLPPLVPRQPQARTVAETLLRDPADRRTLADWAEQLFVASKTLQRAFVAETGGTFSHWRTEVRLATALRLLAAGQNVTVVSRTVGYDTPGGFIAAYRRRFGHTPAAHHSHRSIPVS